MPDSGWSIADTPSGWELRVPLRTPLSVMLARYLRRNRLRMLLMYAFSLGFFGWAAWSLTDSRQAFLDAMPLAVAASLAFFLVLWPLRNSRAGMSDRVFRDGTVAVGYYDLRYLAANRTVTIRRENGRIDVAGNLFAPNHLSSLRVESDVNDTYPGLVDLAFDGGAVPGQRVFGWPGVPEATALAVMRELLRRSDSGSESGSGTLTGAST